jgi:hypothetical protein
VFVVGETGSMDFPSVSSSYSTIYNGGANDSFIVRLNHNLDLLEASTYIGGSQDEDIYALDFDNQDNVCIVLRTASPDYPILPGAFQSTLKGSEDGAVSKLNPDLTSLLASTYLGGSGSDYLSALAFDGSGDLVVAGWTNSVDFPTTAGAFDTTFNGVNDVIVSRFDSTLSTLSTSTFLGGSQGDALSRSQTSMVLGSTGDVFLSGSTFSPDYPVAGACFDTNYDGNEDAFLTRLDSALTRVRGSSYIGGSGTDRGRSIALGSGNIYVTGFTNSADFPTTEGAYSRVLTGANDAFVSRFTPDLTLGSDGGGGGGCFIATAVFQQSNGERYIRTFKNFRDQRLLGNPLGERLVGLYYRLSPPVADWIKDHPLAGKILALCSCCWRPYWSTLCSYYGSLLSSL